MRLPTSLTRVGRFYSDEPNVDASLLPSQVSDFLKITYNNYVTSAMY